MKYLASYIVLFSLLGSSLAPAQVIYNNASTAGEGYARGMSGVIQAQGQRNLSNSQAAINLTDARSSQIDNQVKSVNAFWEKKDIYSQHQQQKLAAIDQKRSSYMAKHGLGTLTTEEFDRTTGQINWPRALEQSQYDPYRNKLNELFDKRAKYGALTSDNYMEAMMVNKQWRDMLAKQRDTYPSQVLSQLIRFVLKVNRELDDNLS